MMKNRNSINGYAILWWAIVGLTMLVSKPMKASNCVEGLVKKQLHVVFLISEDPLNYEADRTVPLYAAQLAASGTFKVTILKSEGDRKMAYIPKLKTILKADLLVVFARRLALQPKQMKILKTYVERGNPVVGLRTANHAFSIREEVAEGYEDWWGFVPEVLGSENRGYEPEELGTVVKIKAENRSHEILSGIEDAHWKSKGQVYKTAPLLDENAVVLLTGSTINVTEPIAWTRKTIHGGKVFYTALGYPTDFEDDQYVDLVTNAISWALKKE